MTKPALASRSFAPAPRRFSVSAACAAALAALCCVPAARSASFYWSGDNNAFWNTLAGANGTNWSSSPGFNNGTLGLPGAADDVFFNIPGAINLNTQLGQNFSIKSLTFTPLDTAGVTIGGANTLTLGTGGLTNNSAVVNTISSAVALGVNQTWTNNSSSALAVSGAIGGGGTNLTLAGIGTFNLTGANSYSGTTALSTVGTTLRLSGTAGSLATSSISLEGGTLLNLDSTGGDHASNNRIGDTVGIGSKGGTIRLLGSATTSETVGTLTLTTGLTRVIADAGTTLTFGAAGAPASLARLIGGTVNFFSTGTIKAPNVALTNGILGGYATIGNPDSNSGANALDFATVTGGNVVPLATYTSNNLLTDFVAANNVKVSGAVGLTGTTQTANSLYLTGAAAINFGGTANSTNTLVIGTGGIISNAATLTFGSDNQPDLTTAAIIGNGTVSANNVSGGVPQGRITASSADLVVTTASNLRINAVITGAIGLTKNGAGILDLSNGNHQTASPAGRVANTYSGITTVNGGILLINDDPNLGANPASFTANAITLNGGEIRTTRGITFNANRGFTVGTQGGTVSYVGGATLTLANAITGAGQMTFSAIPANANTNFYVLNFAQNANTYQGATTFNLVKSTTGSANVTFNADNQIPDNSAVNVIGDPAAAGGVNLNGKTDVWGSLAGAATARIYNLNAALTVGQNNLTTTYAGKLEGNVSGSLTKVGTGALTLSGITSYSGATNIHGGTLYITGAPTGNGLISAGNAAGTLGGTLGGNGTIAAPVTVNALGHLAPALNPTSTNTLAINNNLTLNAGSTLDYNFGALGTPGTSDLVTIGGAGNLLLNAGADVLNITALPGFGIGTYNLLTLTGSGTFTNNATFTINGSTLFNYAVLNPGQAIDASAGGGVVPANTLRLQVLAGNPNFFWTGAVPSGVWDVNNTPNWTGAGTKFLSGGNVTFDDVNLVGGGVTNVTVAAGGVSANSIVFNNGTNNYAFGGNAITVTAGAGVTKNQAGSVAFNGTVTTPLTSVNAGSLNVGAAGTYNSTVKVDLNGGTIGVAGALNTPLLNVRSGAALNVSGSLASTTALTVDGAATFTNTSQTIASLGDNAGATTGVVSLAGTALTVTASSTYDGIITGTGSLTANTNGTLTLTNGASNFTGGTTISGNTLLVTNTTGSATGSGTVSILSGGTLAGTRIGGSLVSQSGSTFSPGTGLPLTGDIGTFNVGGGITINAGSVLDFDLTSPGVGDTVNLTGALTIGAGASVLNVFENAGFGAGNYVLYTAASVANTGATFTINPSGPGVTPSLSYSVVKIDNTLVLTVEPPTDTWTGLSSNVWDTTSPNWTPAPTGVFTNGRRARFDDTPGTDQLVLVDAGGVTPFDTFFDNSFNYSIDSSAGAVGIAGSGGLTKNGPGTVTLIGANTFTGTTTINNGTLSINADNNLGTAPAVATAKSLTISGGTLQFAATTTLSTNRGITAGSGNAILNVAFTAGGSLDLQTTTGVKYSGAISGPGVVAITGGSGTNDPVAAPYLLVLNGQANTYTGDTIIDNATVTNDAGSVGGNILPATTVLTLNNHGVFAVWGNLNGLTTQTLAGLVGDSTGLLGTENNTTPTTFTINTAAATTYTYGGQIGDVNVLGRGRTLTGGAPVSLVKAGGGTQILTGLNPYTGSTTISGGTLQVGDGGISGTIGTGEVVDNALLAFNRSDNLVVANAISGTGSVTNSGGAGNVLKLSGAQGYATLNANSGTTNVTGSFTTGTATVNASAILNFGADQTIDALNISNGGIVTLDGALPSPAPGLAEDTGSAFGETASLAPPTLQGVPEPGTAMLLGTGLISVLGFRRVRKAGFRKE